MRPALLAPVLALLAGIAAPLAAQESAAPDTGGEPAPDPAPPSPPTDPVLLISGPDPLMAQFGTMPLYPKGELCLAAGEAAVLASDRTTFRIEGEGCLMIAKAEREAFENEQLAREQQTLDEARTEYEAALEGGDTAAADAAYERYAKVASNAPEKEWVDEIAIARAASIAERERQERERMAPPSAAPGIRVGATRESASRPPPPRPVIFRIANASPSVLQRVPRGTLVERTTVLCLMDGEQVTISASIGQSVTYTGPGCARRNARPTSDNVGGFSFG